MPPLMLRWRPLHITIILLGVIPAASWAAEPSLCPSQTAPPVAQSRTPPPSSKTPQEWKPGADGAKIEVNSDRVEYSVTGDMTLKGHVNVKQGDREIHGDEIRYSAKDNTIKTDSSL